MLFGGGDGTAAHTKRKEKRGHALGPEAADGLGVVRQDAEHRPGLRVDRLDLSVGCFVMCVVFEVGGWLIMMIALIWLFSCGGGGVCVRSLSLSLSLCPCTRLGQLVGVVERHEVHAVVAGVGDVGGRLARVGVDDGGGRDAQLEHRLDLALRGWGGGIK